MRIRKHAKFASSSPGTVVQTYVCPLNQSPWDVMTFSAPSSPPPPSQSNGSGVWVGNGSSEGFGSVSESGSFRRRSEHHDAKVAAAEDIAPPIKNKGSIMCCKTDGKSWHCRREVAEGNSLCEHHLSLVKSYSSAGHHHAGKKSVKSSPPPAAAEAQRRTRPKKAPASSNSYEFYYYSGFGPKWGRRRGETRKNHGGGNVGVEMAPPATAEVSYIGDEQFDFIEYEEEDDDEDDEEEGRDNGRKRMRKPIKARSLKSLL